ncbi:LacI family DNA-binding transcriptional regulator [Tenggerimyces flavus]|uniref:LacI family DNA-binding transcriptional regulator n=1 Tax=Tenggerimyces flavus TaxID=1708749 RepID=A0ABV7YL97_9ACTN|nr:LacI family DNA-binding transcriptional regulator [Tenggerimyces flavus]MBM7788725.1 DNA-binding LacI/PurR family transcriptional regulator [Tenggerimyces flavus]
MPERERGRRLTIADVAKHAGVSKGAVSFALNGRPGVAPATRQRILEVAEELGWTPSQAARGLSVKRAFALGLVIARDPVLLGSDPFFPAFIAGVETVMAERSHSLVLQVVRDAEEEAEGYRRLARDRRVDGVFLTDLRRRDPRLKLLDDLAIPAVTLNVPDEESPHPAARLDHEPGIAQAVDHLVAQGHTNLAHVAGPEEYVHGHGRREAFQKALERHGLPPGRVEAADFTAAGGREATQRLLNTTERPTAIVYANDLMAIAGMNVAQQLGIDVPGELSVTGYDDTELAAHIHPGLTTVRTNVFAWGQVAAHMLVSLVEGNVVADVELEPPELVVRGSTSTPSTRKGQRT